jgi:hypothetical protein
MIIETNVFLVQSTLFKGFKSAGLIEDIKFAYPGTVQNIREGHQLGNPGENRK